MNGDFDWNLAKSFLAVFDLGSLSAAARSTGLSQPTLGRHVSELETSLGILLFERSRDGLKPTPAALAIAQEARNFADAGGRIAMLAAGRSQSVSGTVRITASEIVASYLLPQILGPMLAALPGIDIELVATNTVENLLRRDADIAIRMVEPQQLDLIARKIAELPIGVYATRSYLEKHGTPATLEEFRHHVVIGYDRSDLVLRGFASIGYSIDQSFFRLRMDSQHAAFEALLAGAGIGFAPLWLASRHANLVRFAEAFSIRPMQMWLVAHAELRTSAKIRAVYDHLGAAFANMDLGR